MFEEIMKAQSGDSVVREQLLAQYKPFVAKTAAKVCGRFIDPLNDDEFSIAFGAFNEAIDRYDPQKQSSFLTFAETMIRNKLVDYFRQQQKFDAQIAFSSLANADEDFVDVQERVSRSSSLNQFAQEQLQEARKLEIAELQQTLRPYGIQFADLVKLSPKHDDSRRMLGSLAQRMVEDDSIRNAILTTNKLPLLEVSNRLAASRKTLERHRKYLIALTVILAGSFPNLRSFLVIDAKPKEVESP